MERPQIRSRTESIRLMDEWGREDRAFFFFISYDMEHNLAVPLDVPHEGLSYSLPGAESNGHGMVPDFPEHCFFRVRPVPFDEYRKAFSIVGHHLARGDSYLVNLTCSTEVDTNLDFRHLYDRARADYRVLYTTDRESIVCFSPEPFVRIRGNVISTHPMKGTIPADRHDACSILMADEKEQREHATIVDLLRNDLSIVAGDVRVPRYRYVDRLDTSRGTILQTSSEITGALETGWESRIGRLLFSLLPAGSITGAPKASTMDVIRKAETHQRGLYTGVFGYYRRHRVESAVAIRFMERKGGCSVYKSGGGITAMSRAEDEFREMVGKVYVPFALPDDKCTLNHRGC